MWHVALASVLMLEALFGPQWCCCAFARLTTSFVQNVTAKSDKAEAKRIKALRYFITAEGWAPRYTATPIRIGRLAGR